MKKKITAIKICDEKFEFNEKCEIQTENIEKLNISADNVGIILATHNLEHFEDKIIAEFCGESVAQTTISFKAKEENKTLNITLSADQYYNPVHIQTVIFHLPKKTFNSLRINAQMSFIDVCCNAEKPLINTADIMASDTVIKIRNVMPFKTLKAVSLGKKNYCAIYVQCPKLTKEVKLINLVSDQGNIDIDLVGIQSIEENKELKMLDIEDGRIILCVSTNGEYEAIFKP